MDVGKPNQMAKTDRHFIPLSWEHRHGLVLVWRIRRGVEKQTDPGVIAAYLLKFWDRYVHPHFETEETLLLPQMDEENPMVRQLRRDHQILRKMAENIHRDMNDNPAYEPLEAFAETLNRHIRFEEREVFPLAAATIPPEPLHQLEEALHARFHKVDEDWTPAFWE